MGVFPLEKYRFDLLLIRETADRIIQDFESFGLEIVFSGNERFAYEELTAQLKPFFEELTGKNKPLLMRILYKIDISEQKLAKTREAYPQASLPEVISHLVVEREMQKVITRKMFKP